MPTNKKDTSWGGVADWYDAVVENPDSYQNKVILPNLLSMMHIAPGERLLDIACGTGFFTSHFKKAGADVVGADVGQELIEKARAADSTIPYHVAPADDLSFATDNSFDIATIILALQNIEELEKSVLELARVLVPGGRAYIVLNHPTFRIHNNSFWGFDDYARIQYRRIDRYLSEIATPVAMHPGKSDEETHSFHRPISVFTKHFRASGLVITNIEEWISHKKSEPGPKAMAENRARKEIPLFMALEIRK